MGTVPAISKKLRIIIFMTKWCPIGIPISIGSPFLFSKTVISVTQPSNYVFLPFYKFHFTYTVLVSPTHIFQVLISELAVLAIYILSFCLIHIHTTLYFISLTQCYLPFLFLPELQLFMELKNLKLPATLNYCRKICM